MEGLWLLPLDAQNVDWHTSGNDGQAYERLHWQLNQSHEYNEQADDEKSDRIEKADLMRENFKAFYKVSLNFKMIKVSFLL